MPHPPRTYHSCLPQKKRGASEKRLFRATLSIEVWQTVVEPICATCVKSAIYKKLESLLGRQTHAAAGKLLVVHHNLSFTLTAVLYMSWIS